MRTSSRTLLTLCLLLLPLAVLGQGVAPDTTTSQALERKRPLRPAFCTPGIVTQASSVVDVAVDRTWVYFGDMQGRVQRVPKQGGTPEILATVPGEIIFSIEIDGTYVYFNSMIQSTGIGETHRVPKTGGAVETLASGIRRPWHLALDQSSVYVAEAGTYLSQGQWSSDGRILRMSKDQPGAETLAEGLSVPMSVMPDSEYVYFTELGIGSGNSSAGLRRVPKGGGTIERVTDAFGALAITGDTDALYLFHISGSDLGSLLRCPRDGSDVQVLASGIHFDVYQELRILNRRVHYIVSIAGGFAVAAVPCAGGESYVAWNEPLAFPQFTADECQLYGGTSTGIARAQYK